MDKSTFFLMKNCNNCKDCCPPFRMIDDSSRFMLLTPSMLSYVKSAEHCPCIILDNPPYGDLVMPWCPIRPSRHVTSAKFVEDSFKIEETRILSKTPGTGINKGYWKIRILYVFTFDIEFYNFLGKKLKICYLNSKGEADESAQKDSLKSYTKYIQTVILAGPKDCNCTAHLETHNQVEFKEQCYPFIQVNSDAIPFDIKVKPYKKDDEDECPSCPDPYKHHEVEIDVSIILFTVIKLFGFEKECCCKEIKVVINEPDECSIGEENAEDIDDDDNDDIIYI